MPPEAELNIAERMLRDGDTQAAIRVLTKLVRDHPGTEPAEKATVRLKELKELEGSERR